MRLAVLGGGTILDKSFMKRLLGHGFTAHMLVESTDGLALKHKNLHITRGLCSDQTIVEKVIGASHAVVCLPGVRYDEQTLDTIIKGMQASDLRRLVVATQLMYSRRVADALSQTRLDWTVVHATGFDEDEAKSLPHDFAISINDFAKFIINQIADVTYLHSAVIVKQ